MRFKQNQQPAKRYLNVLLAKPDWYNLALGWDKMSSSWRYYKPNPKEKEHLYSKDYYKFQDNTRWFCTISKPSSKVLQSDELNILGDSTENLENFLNKTEKIMENKNYIGGEYYVIGCQQGNESMTWAKVDKDIEVKENDYVVIDKPQELYMQVMQVQTVISVDLRDIAQMKAYNRANCWLVDTVDITRLEARIVATERKQLLMTQLKERRDQMQELVIYEMLAKSDSTAAKLLEELKQLGAL